MLSLWGLTPAGEGASEWQRIGLIEAERLDEVPPSTGPRIQAARRSYARVQVRADSGRVLLHYEEREPSP
jgi:hypothetical protein